MRPMLHIEMCFSDFIAVKCMDGLMVLTSFWGEGLAFPIKEANFVFSLTESTVWPFRLNILPKYLVQVVRHLTAR